MALNVPDCNVVLFGKTGSGKSSFGNTLLDRQDFEVEWGMSSGTKTTNMKENTIYGVNLKVIDVPGLSDTHRNEEETLCEIAKSTSVASPGPHVAFFLIAANRRFTKEEEDAYTTIKELFTPDICRFMVVGFTNVDGLKKPENVTREEKLREAIENSPPAVREILKDVNNRHIAIENSASDEDKAKQREDAIKLIKNVYEKNHGHHYDLPEKINTAVQKVIDRRAQKEGCTKQKAEDIVKYEIVAGKQQPLVRNVQKRVKKLGWRCNIL